MPLTIEERKENLRAAVQRWKTEHHEEVKEYQREYWHRPEVKANRRTLRKERVAKLRELGLLPSQPRGRPPIYSACEEAVEAKRQQKLCNRNRRERIAQAVEALRELENHASLAE